MLSVLVVLCPQLKRVLQFPSTHSVPQIIEGISHALTDMGCEIRVFEQMNKVGHKQAAARQTLPVLEGQPTAAIGCLHGDIVAAARSLRQIKATKMTPKGMIGVIFQIYSPDDDIEDAEDGGPSGGPPTDGNMVEVRRGKVSQPASLPPSLVGQAASQQAVNRLWLMINPDGRCDGRATSWSTTSSTTT